MQQIIAEICQSFANQWRAGNRPRIEDYLPSHLDRDSKRILFKALLASELFYRIAESPAIDEFLPRFHDFEDLIQDAFQSQTATATHGPLLFGSTSTGQNLNSQSALIKKFSDLVDLVEDPLPAMLGRYKILDELGSGTYGIVYKGWDDRLKRHVAIKVPRREIVERMGGSNAYIREACVVASLKHPNIVKVHDIGDTEDGLCYVVYEFIDGDNLQLRLASGQRFNPAEAATLIAILSDALAYAHSHENKIKHRDIKPANILIDEAGKPYLTDFGLAHLSGDFGTGPQFAGTVAYMSPEQARYESHRVDGRSDIFSIGVVFYEMLTGMRPFDGTREQVLEMIVTTDVIPPRQMSPGIPIQLETICLKATARQIRERYSTAADLAADLRTWLEQAEKGVAAVGGDKGSQESIPTLEPPRKSEQVDAHPLKIIPRGLRSYDAQDSSFFLDLLPGPRELNGLPQVVNFWKSRLESKEDGFAFPVGLLYGPSGCGKSSLVKAGVLPELPSHVLRSYIEATPQGTESRLLHGLQKICPALDARLDLVAAVESLRRGRGLSTGHKVVLVIDQFEQWLHGRKVEKSAVLVSALRHCDGTHVQALLLVRDDFWMAVTRFFREDLEIPLREDDNSAAVDLFDTRHSRQVLADLGRAYQALPATGLLSPEQSRFLDEAIEGLAEDGRLVPVRLALFAEMVKSRQWEPATLKAIGGVAGVGVRFLEETFGESAATLTYRSHRKAATAILRVLLPEVGTNIKGQMQPLQRLMEVSGYEGSPRDFEEVLRILDSDLRLITPTDADGSIDAKRDAIGSSASDETPARYYQLSHDYLVPSLRDWLTRKQMETRQGRAELQLANRSAVWNDRKENRFLPSLIEWASIRLLTRRRDWTLPQRTLMQRADRHHILRSLASLAFLLVLGLAGREYIRQQEAYSLRDRLISADVSEVPTILKALESNRHRITPLLQQSFATEKDPKIRLKLSLALVQSDANQIPFLLEQLLQSSPENFAVIRDVMEPFKNEILGKLWGEYGDPKNDRDRRFRSACALVEFAREDPRWDECSVFLVDSLMAEEPLTWSHWKAALQSVSERLLPALALILEDGKWAPSERLTIIDFYRSFAGSDQTALRHLENRITLQRPGLSDAEAARRKATLLAALASLGKSEEVWHHLEFSPNPTLRSYLIERLGTSGLDPKIIKTRLEREAETSIRRALILALGGFPPDRLPEMEEYLVNLYEHDPDPGIHGATGWVLRKWNRQLQRLARIDQKLATGHLEGNRRWYVSPSGLTFSTISAPSLIPPANPGMTHRFAIATTEVTEKQFKDRPNSSMDLPANLVSWYMAAEYCNALSQAENIPESEWCYQSKKGRLEIVVDYLQKTGYRLPTVAEWELACLAGARTGWHFGDADRELTGCYAWWILNSNKDNSGPGRSPVARLKPNDFGLFDMHGNVVEWCQEPTTRSSVVDEGVVKGGAYTSQISGLVAKGANTMARTNAFVSSGFRPARTIR